MTPMQEHRAANPAPNPDDKHTVLGYLVEPEDVVKLTVICKQLHGGTDRERDYGHRLWLIINTLRDLAGGGMIMLRWCCRAVVRSVPAMA